MMFRDKYSQFKKSEVGFCWSVLLLGSVVPMSRKDMLGSISMLMTFFGCLLSLNFWVWAAMRLFFAFIYNKNHVRRLIQSGYYPIEDCHAKLVVAYGYATVEEIRENRPR